MIAASHLPPDLRAQIEREARDALPRECCGLIEGKLAGDTAQVAALHRTRNLSTDIDRFEIDPAAHIRLMRDLRGSGHRIIGCYHSHPHGRVEPSERDHAGALDENFLWLICGVDRGAAQVGAFLFENGRFRVLELRESASA